MIGDNVFEYVVTTGIWNKYILKIKNEAALLAQKTTVREANQDQHICYITGAHKTTDPL